MDLASTSTVAEHVDVQLRLDAARSGGAAGGAAATARGERARREGGRGAGPAGAGGRRGGTGRAEYEARGSVPGMERLQRACEVLGHEHFAGSLEPLDLIVR
jgi:hypothetical protein